MTVRIPLRRWLAAGVAALLALGVSGAPARADATLSTPGVPVAGEITTTSVALSWSPSTGPVASYTLEVTPIYAALDERLITTTATTHLHTGLKPDTVYQYRVWANPLPGSGASISLPSKYLTIRTRPVPDSVPPTTPGGVYVRNVGTISATVNVRNFSTDNYRVAGYVIQRQIDGVWTDVATNDITELYLRDLTANTSYTFVVLAFDANGNRSAPSEPVTFSTEANTPYPTCKVQFNGFGAYVNVSVTIKNFTADTVLTDWRLRFTLTTAVTVGGSFGMTITRSGDQATGTPPAWNTPVRPGGGASGGFNASAPWGTVVTPPSGFTVTSANLDPIPCTS